MIKVYFFILGAFVALSMCFIITQPVSRSEAMYVVGEVGTVEYDDKYLVIRIVDDSVGPKFYESCAKLSKTYDVIIINTPYRHGN